MSYIRIFVNGFGLQALKVWEDDLYSFRVLREGDFERNVEIARRLVPAGFRSIGALVEKNQITYRYLRDSTSFTELPLPENLDELGFDFENSKESSQN